MEEEKMMHCPGCGGEMEKGYMQVTSPLTFGKERRKILSMLDTATVAIHPIEHDFVTGELCFHAWHCPDCGYILFDTKDPRAGKGQRFRDTLADGMDKVFDAIDNVFPDNKEE